MKKLLATVLFLICQSVPLMASPPPIPPGPIGISANGGTGNNITLNGTTNITGGASNAVTQPFTDSSNRIATDAFVQSIQQVTRSTVTLWRNRRDAVVCFARHWRGVQLHGHRRRHHVHQLRVRGRFGVQSRRCALYHTRQL